VTISVPRCTGTKRKRTYAPTGDVGRHLARARELQLQIQELSALYDTEREWLLQHMAAKGLNTVELGAIRAFMKQRNRWTYSAETERELQQLQITQKWEQSHGIATNTPSTYVSLTEVSQ